MKGEGASSVCPTCWCLKLSFCRLGQPSGSPDLTKTGRGPCPAGQGAALSMINRHPKKVSVLQARRDGLGWAAGCWLLLLLLSKHEVQPCCVPKSEPSPSFSRSLGRILRCITLDLGSGAVGRANPSHYILPWNRTLVWCPLKGTFHCKRTTGCYGTLKGPGIVCGMAAGQMCSPILNQKKC